MHQVVSHCDKLIHDWEVACADRTGPSVIDFRVLVSGLVPDRYSHLVHSYPAKLLPQIPHFFLQSNQLTPRGQDTIVADPFCGSGTVLLEAILRGFQTVGADTNPLARLIARVKTRPLSRKAIRANLAKINRAVAKMPQRTPPPVVNILHWYPRLVAAELAKLRAAIKDVRSEPIREFMQICLSACARKMSFADPRLSVPVKINLARKAQYGRHYRQLRSHMANLKPANVSITFNAVVEKNASRMEVMRLALAMQPRVQIHDDVHDLSHRVDCGTVDLIITSPPYLGAQKYIRASSLGLGWLDLAYEGQLRPLERVTIGREHFSKSEIGSQRLAGIPRVDELLRKVQQLNPVRAHIAWTYLAEMERAIVSMHRVLRAGGNLILITGPNTICGRQFDTPSILEELAHRVGFTTRFKLVDHIRSRGLMTKRNKTAGLISSEWVLGLRKQ